MNIKYQISIILSILLVIVISSFAYMYKDELYIFYRDNILQERTNIKISKNKYYKEENYELIQNTDKFIVETKQEITNAIYTIINSGEKKFTFYCNDNYFTCTNDVEEIVNNQELLSTINNYVHPFNSFKEINVSYNDHGNIEVQINKNYTNDEINEINNKIDQILEQEINDEDNEKEKIKKIHNYIINNSKYATEKIISENPDIKATKAIGVLIDGYGTCNSYSDAMAIILERLNINNYKVASETHIWNLVYLNDKWYHLDLTWDDPVNSDGSDSLETIFFMITTNRLKNLKVEMHDYNENYYKETKTSES